VLLNRQATLKGALRKKRRGRRGENVGAWGGEGRKREEDTKMKEGGRKTVG